MKYFVSRSLFLTLFTVCTLISCSVNQSFAQENSPEQQNALHDAAMTAFEAVKTGELSKLEDLGAMLNDPRLNTAARTALENLPNRAGVETLRKGLGASDDRCVAGVAASLGSMRDSESVERLIELASCDCHSEIIRIAVLQSLGKIAGKDAIAALYGALYDSNIEIQRAAADGLFTAAKEIAASDPKQAAEWFQRVREARIDGPATRIAAQNELLYTENTELFLSLLKSSDPADVRSAQIVMVQNPSDPILNSALKSLPTLSAESRRAALATLGSAGNRNIVPALITVFKTAEPDSQLEILTALSDLQDERVCEVFVTILRETQPENPLHAVASAGICRLDAEKIIPVVKELLNSETPAIRLAALQIAQDAKLTPLQKDVKLRMTDDSDAQVAASAMNVYSRILVPTPGDIAEFATVFAHQSNIPADVFDSAFSNLCRKTSDKKETLEFLERTYADAPLNLVKYAGMVGGPAAAQLLGDYALKYAQNSETGSDSVVDLATQLLGRWTTVDAAPVLARLAATHPNEKYRKRTLNGYLRILRQMGMTPLEKRQMLNNAQVLSEGNPDAQARFAEIADRFNREFPETQLFNGTDFTGWESYTDGIFRIEDGAIVGGNFETGVDRNQFLTTTQSFGDFYLRMECKIVDAPSNVKKDGNAGVQIRSERIPNHHEMIGYQADMTSDGGYWGCLYDESRRRRMLQMPNPELLKTVWKPNEWNRYEILAQGRNIRIFLNGVETVNYTETDETIPLTGLIGLQIHAGGPAQSYYRSLFISTAATSDSRW